MIGVKTAQIGNATIRWYCIDGDQIAAPEVASHVQTRRYFKCAAQNIVEKFALLNGRSIPVKEQVCRFILSVELIWGMLHKCLQIASSQTTT